MTIPVHHSVETEPYERGLAFGRANAAAVANTVAAYEHLFAATGIAATEVDRLAEATGAILDREWPELARELAGIADGASRRELELLAVNARTEILKGHGGPECSAVYTRDRDAHTILAQNWDYHPRLAGSVVVWIVHRPAGGWFATMTEAGQLAKIGLNDARLGVCLNLLTSSADGGEIGVPIHVLLRLVLERCRSVDDAAALLQRASTSASSAITVAQPSDPAARCSETHAVTVELSPGGASTINADRAGVVYVHTNHFLEQPRAGRDSTVDEYPDTVARLETLTAAAPRDHASVKTSLTSHDGYPRSICRHDDREAAELDRAVTLASVVMALDEPRFEIALGAPCSAAYEAVELPAERSGGRAYEPVEPGAERSAGLIVTTGVENGVTAAS
jgi:isopenicillin-N N-acyltransferase like protein